MSPGPGREIEAYLTQHHPVGEDEMEEAAAEAQEGGGGGGEEEEEEEEVGEQRGAKRRSRGSKFGSKLSEAMQNFLGVKSMPRGQVG